MGKRVLILLSVVLLAGCTRVIDDAQPQRERPVGPIAANQVDDLVSRDAQGGDASDSLYAGATPDDCTGVVQEVRAPFIFGAGPVAHSGGYFYDDDAQTPGNVVEIVGVYHSDFDPMAAVEAVGRTVTACRDDVLTVTDLDGEDVDHFTVRPRSDSGSPRIVLWALTDTDDTDGWACDNAFVAAHNAAIEITKCQAKNGYGVLPLAQAALARIEALANARI